MLLFVAGFTLVFVALGAAASGIHDLLTRHQQLLTTVAGATVVFLGAVMLLGSLPARIWRMLGPRISARTGWLVGERRLHVHPQTLGAWAAPVMGMAFAFAWTPCIGPVLSALLALASLRATLAGGILLLFAYSLGLGVPFVLTGLAFDRLTRFYGRARRHLALVQVLAGIVLLAFGVVLLLGDLGWVSAQFSNLLNHLGLQNLTTS
ncbi:MAG: cytochrome c biogenesis CcdA family protein [Acidimicrobiales bacterium]